MKSNPIGLVAVSLAAMLIVSGTAWGQMAPLGSDTGYPGDPYAADSRDPYDTTYPHEYPYPLAPVPLGGLTVIAPAAALAAVPAPPLVTGRSVAAGQMGNYCSTPAKACELYRALPAGSGCSCKAPGGRARGLVTR
ncbi:MAG TPA: hypothetical protein VEK34_10990 [Methylocella sp.]|nr:hypothetical protein [Methylocella sp.]